VRQPGGDGVEVPGGEFHGRDCTAALL
jgi:hypothetical protein